MGVVGIVLSGRIVWEWKSVCMMGCVRIGLFKLVGRWERLVMGKSLVVMCLVSVSNGR